MISDLRIGRHALGTPTSVEDLHIGGAGRAMQFGYDGAHRLISAEVAGRTFAFSYDGLQNLTARNMTGPAIAGLPTGNFTFAAQHPRRVTRAGDQTLTYDAAGRAITAGQKTLKWDAFDRLIALTIDGETQRHSYGIGGLRTLTERIDGSEERWFSENHLRIDGHDTFYVVVAGRRVAKVTQKTAASAAPWMPGAPVGPELPAIIAALALLAALRSPRHRFALRTAAAGSLLLTSNACSCSAQAAGTFYLHRTIAPGPSLITNESGELIDDRLFSPYGHPIEANIEQHPMGHGDKALNPTTKWADHGARWLAHDLGRWLAPDPPLDYPEAKKVMAAPWNFTNPYTALGNNPVAFEDGDGESPTCFATPRACAAAAAAAVTVCVDAANWGISRAMDLHFGDRQTISAADQATLTAAKVGRNTTMIMLTGNPVAMG